MQQMYYYAEQPRLSAVILANHINSTDSHLLHIKCSSLGVFMGLSLGEPQQCNPLSLSSLEYMVNRDHPHAGHAE